MSAEQIKTIAGEIHTEALAELSRLKSIVTFLKDQSETIEKSLDDYFKVIAICQIMHNRSKLGHKVIGILGERDQRIREIEKRLAYESTHVSDYESMLSKINFKLDAACRIVQQELLQDAYYQQLKLKISNLIESSHFIEGNMSIVIQEMEEKRAEYDADIVFSYLLKKGYNTPAYNAKRVERYFDNRLAEKYDYGNNFLNYSTINRVVDAASKKAGEVHAEIRSLTTEVESIEQRNPHNDEIKELRISRDKLEEKIKKSKTTRNSISDELLEYSAQSDDLFCDALITVTNLIKNFAIEAIIKMVSLTPPGKDDSALEELVKIRNEISLLNERINNEEGQIKLSERTVKRAKSVSEWVGAFADSNQLSEPIKKDEARLIISKAVYEGWYQSELTESLSRTFSR